LGQLARFRCRLGRFPDRDLRDSLADILTVLATPPVGEGDTQDKDRNEAMGLHSIVVGVGIGALALALLCAVISLWLREARGTDPSASLVSPRGSSWCPPRPADGS